jgi:putative restriction endonuclease
VKAFVGVTDLDWYSQLYASGPDHAEVNFWFPSSGTGFAALESGEFFVLKTHVEHRYPHLSNRLVGVGVFSGYARLRLSEAWQWFGTNNGVESEVALRERIERYRRQPTERLSDPEIGCVLLRDVLFFSAEESVASSADFSANIVRGKIYDLDTLARDHPVVATVTHYLDPGANLLDVEARTLAQQKTRGDARLVVPRVGQQAFKALVAEAYHHRCALTGDKVRPVLEAAHIVPVGHGGEHRIDNGMLLRSDMHTLFDRGYIGFDKRHDLRVSPALRERFGNGDWLYSREGTRIALPDRRAERPNSEYLEWHLGEVFVS